MITDVTTDEKIDLLSSHGYAWGYVGSTIPFFAGIYLIIGLPFGLTNIIAVKIYIIITSVWWFALTLPLIKKLQNKNILKNLKNTI